MNKIVRMLFATTMALYLGSFVFAGGTNEVTVADEKKEITFLTQTHYVEGYDEQLQKIADEWAAENGMTVRIDFISRDDFPARLAAESSAKSGHDIVFLWSYAPALYQDQLVNLDDIAENMEKNYGKWSEAARKINIHNGHWKALNWYDQIALPTINTDYWKEIGIESEVLNEMTWEDLLVAAKKLHDKGHPIGFAFNDMDGWAPLNQIMWSYGAYFIDESGKISLDTDQMRTVIDYVVRLSEYMPDEVHAWDGGGNNRFMLSGLGAWTVNTPSIKPAAVKNEMPIADKFEMTLPPKGPEGRFVDSLNVNVGIWDFSPNIDESKDLLSYIFNPENMKKQIEASHGYNIPAITYKDDQVYEYFSGDEYLKHYMKLGDKATILPSGGIAKPGREISIIFDMKIIPIMFGKAVRGEPADDVIKWATKAIQDLN